MTALSALVADPRPLEGEAVLRFTPFGRCAAGWDAFTRHLPAATIYHRRPWLEVLIANYGIELWTATLDYRDEIAAGCLFARSPRPFSRRLVSLPDSEIGGPLARLRGAEDALIGALLRTPHAEHGLEVHGFDAPPPWETVRVFARWTIDMDRRAGDLFRSLDRDVRRNVRHARESGITVMQGDTIDFVRRFHVLHVDTRRRLGLPPRPFAHLHNLHRIFRLHDAIEVRIATHRGKDLAALLILRDGDVVYAKMNARCSDCPSGANHLLFADALDDYAGRVRTLDLGRVDIRNRGLVEFKRRLGAVSTPLPYAYFPRAPRNVSSESLNGSARAISRVLRHLPLWTTRTLGRVVYGFLV